jgi:hypothetical protein
MDELAFLASPTGQALLAQLADQDIEGNLLSLVAQLRKTYPADQVNGALTQAKLRQKAVSKFGNQARVMFFTEDALQQASDPLIRAYRTAQVNGLNVVDLCCSIGADALAFGMTNPEVLGVDIDPSRIAIAQHNAQVLGLSHVRFVVDDVLTMPPPPADVIFFDPARRDTNGRRIHDVRRYIPPLDTINRYQAQQKIIKLSPGVAVDQLHSIPSRLVFISVGGDLKEAVMQVGESGRTAVYLDATQTLEWHHDGDEPDAIISAPRRYLIEPDPAIIRASLVRQLAETLDGVLLDETIAYITADDAPQSAWYRSWEIIDWMPFNLKALRAYLKARDVGTLTVKKRGSAITPEELTAKLKLKGSQSATVALTRHEGKPVVLILSG